MAALNKVMLIGNLTRDPELRYTPSGTAVAELGLAINREYTKEGQRVKDVCFIDVTTWTSTAENCAKYLTKGSPLFVEGRLQMDSWENKQGEKRTKLKVVAERAQFLGSPRDERAPSGAAAGSSRGAAPQPAETEHIEDDVPF